MVGSSHRNHRPSGCVGIIIRWGDWVNNMEILDWSDIDCVARIEIKKDAPSLEFEVFEITAHSQDKNGGFTVKNYERKGATSSDGITENLDEAQTLIRGLIKWDACSHVTFGDEKGYIHLCGGRSWFNFMKATERIWDIAMKELPREHSKDMFDLELFK